MVCQSSHTLMSPGIAPKLSAGHLLHQRIHGKSQKKAVYYYQQKSSTCELQHCSTKRKKRERYDKKHSTNQQLDDGKKENTQKCLQDDAREDGCMSSWVPTPRPHWNCTQILLFFISTLSTDNDQETASQGFKQILSLLHYHEIYYTSQGKDTSKTTVHLQNMYDYTMPG